MRMRAIHHRYAPPRFGAAGATRLSSRRMKTLLRWALLAAALLRVANLYSGVTVAGFGAALVGSLLYSLCGVVIDAALERLFDRKN